MYYRFSSKFKDSCSCPQLKAHQISALILHWVRGYGWFVKFLDWISPLMNRIFSDSPPNLLRKLKFEYVCRLGYVQRMEPELKIRDFCLISPTHIFEGNTPTYSPLQYCVWKLIREIVLVLSTVHFIRFDQVKLPQTFLKSSYFDLQLNVYFTKFKLSRST